jgi:hypothetical protein
MAGGFDVGTDDLGDTAAQTDQLAARVRAAADGVRPIDPLAFGSVGQTFAGLALLAADLIGNGLDDLALGTGRGADGLRGTRDGYLDIERALVTAFDGLAR